MKLFERVLGAAIREGELTVIDAAGRPHRFGKPVDGRKPVVVRFTSDKALRRCMLSPAMGTGEAYMDGTLRMVEGDIHALVDLVTWNGRFERYDPKTAMDRRLHLSNDLFGWWRAYNQERRSKRNVAHHYDLSAALYDLFLDRDRQYSCAYFADPENSLDQAQADKKAHIAAKLALAPGQRVLDIGCGWGGLALYLHEKAGVDVLGITLSEEQLKIARERAVAAGVADRVKFELIDYRKLDGRFDRIVSVGMFEHVGPGHFRSYLAKCRSLLAEDGVMLLHTIGRMGRRKSTDPWTVKYIFPGGYIPTLSEISEAAEATRMITSDVEVLRLHYALTLERWLRRTQAHRVEIEALYDARFYRMWEFYLSSSLTGFMNGQMVNFQIQYVRNRRALPITRDYMGQAEAKLRS
jgi:cyclopropane-fatty-acyl-phospholipid synthase